MNMQHINEGILVTHNCISALFGNKNSVESRIKHPPLSLVKQVHKINIICADDYTCTQLVEADGIYTCSAEKAVGVYTADCVPVLLFSEFPYPIVAAVHAGWRGLSAGIIQKIVQLFLKKRVASESMYALIGPCICGNCYEVSGDVINKFKNNTNYFADCVEQYNENWKIDLSKTAHKILERSRVKNILNTNVCTRCHEQFHSYRGGSITERNYNLIWWEE